MEEQTIRGVSFDLWDTLIVNSEDKRRDTARNQLIQSYNLNPEILNRKIETRENFFSAQERLKLLTSYEKNQGATIKIEDIPSIVKKLSELTLEFLPQLTNSITEEIENLNSLYKLSIISNTFWTSGKDLKKVLQKLGLEKYFYSMVFSDQAQVKKPSADIFKKAWAQLGYQNHEVIHVGDRVKDDILGASSFGAYSLLSKVVRRKKEEGESKASGIFYSNSDISPLVCYISTRTLPEDWELIAQGLPVWGKLVAGKAKIVRNPEEKVEFGEIMVLGNSDPDYEPLFFESAAVLAETGGYGSHAAQTAPMCGTSCIVGASDVRTGLEDGDKLIIDCESGKIFRKRG